MKSPLRLEQIFQDHLQTLALTLRPGTIQNYRCVARRFLQYLHTTFPQLRRLSQLRRDPHILGWFRSLCEQDPRCATKPAPITCCSFGVYSTTWPLTAIPSSLASSA